MLRFDPRKVSFDVPRRCIVFKISAGDGTLQGGRMEQEFVNTTIIPYTILA